MFLSGDFIFQLFMRARWWRADIIKKCIFSTFLVHMLLILARSARAIARAILKLFPMDLYDKIEVICTINHYHNVKIDEGDGPKINESPFWFILRVLEALILKYLPFKYFGPKIKRECCGALQSWDKNVFICIFLMILS